MLQYLFLPLAIAASALALWEPDLFIWAKGYIAWLLGLVMFGMGVTLTPVDFKRVWDHKRLIGIGVVAQFTVMPLLAWLISKAFKLPDEALVGMVLVGACPGGTASNVVTYLARGNVALSVSLTTCSTLLAPLLTPLLVELLASAAIEVPATSMFINILKVVLAPIILGLIVRHFLGGRSKPILKIFPWVAMLSIVFIIAIVMGLNQKNVLNFPAAIIGAVILHNLLGLAMGYGAGWLAGAQEDERRTLAIEVGMQNSGLAVQLGQQFFTGLAALPGALFSLWHNLSGVALASWWNRREAKG
ncbi:bile acid:sodium symporter family protein [Cerasicoccus arenae]|uniref:Transporter n=1 Tax=Cerasicoccus arenae TaxID=424488 RepID=A0A8J3GDV9_9BACT|nr:bile acid:sodium symporter family protein [Cerasicoccus arenae]MBK1857883.1 bile acid:sodium symporter family protein [Cerasicoccus arenae]GHC09444.1 transporter [Cerasicoccus arenae]